MLFFTIFNDAFLSSLKETMLEKRKMGASSFQPQERNH